MPKTTTMQMPKTTTMQQSRPRSGAVCVTQFGAAGDGRVDDFGAIQAALDSGAAVVRIPPGTFLLCNAIRPHSNQCLELQGTLRVADSHVRKLTAPAKPGDDSVEVDDATGFYPGQWVTLCADDSPYWQTRKHADGGRVVAVEGRRLRFGGRLTMEYALSAHPIVGTQHSAVWLDGVSQVRIHGAGTIDGNKANQIDVRPTALAGAGFRDRLTIGGDGGEEIRAACGIAASGPPGSLKHVVIEGITVRDASEHNLCLSGLAFGKILHTTCTGARDKNITLLDSRDCLVSENIASYSEHEDGIMFHQSTGNCRVLVRGNICAGNPRQGIAVGKNERDIHLSGNLCVDNGCNFSLCGTDGSSTGDISRGQNHRRFRREIKPMGVAIGGLRNRIIGLQTAGDRLVHIEFMGREIWWTGGAIQGCAESGDNVGILLGPSKNLDADPPSLRHVELRQLRVSGCATAVHAHGSMEAVTMADCQLEENLHGVLLEPGFAGGFDY